MNAAALASAITKTFAQQRLLLSILLTAVLCLSLTPMIASAATSLTPTVIDDFEDGDASDWGFFGGNNAGGGGGILGDRPREGSFYFSTGWGGDGTASGFYGGAFRNLDNGGQVIPPAEPWFNVWVLNQSDATVDQYTLEITLREDLDGDGWTGGAEDSFRLDTTFTSTEFDDQWVLVSAPLSSFADQFTGGDGVFNGNLDEVVIVISGVQGGPGTTVEVDFDQFSFTSGGPVSSPITVFDDMEHGDPFGNGWFAFNGSVGGGGIAPNSADLPPRDGGAFSLETGWGSGGVPGFFGGFGRTNPVDLSDTDHFNFWINPDAGQDYTLEINLQEDDNGDDAVNPPDDDEFQYNCVISPTGPCAISGGGWQQISIPLADFFDDNSFFTGGNGVLDAVATTNGGNGQLINVVIAVIGNSGSDVNFRTDYWVFSEGPLADSTQIVDDFENGLPTGADVNGTPIGFYTFSDGSPIAIATTTTPPAPLPGSSSGNNVLAMTGNVTAFAGFIHAFENDTVDTWTPQDWSAFLGFRVWVYGQNTGTQLFIDILDNRNPGSTTDDAERFTVTFVDDFSGWQLLEFPFSSFVRKEIGNGAPNDGFTLTEVHGWALGTLSTPGEVTFYADDAALYGAAEIPALTVNFSAGGYDIDEGTTGTVTVELSRPMNSDDPAQVAVDYFTEPGTATPGRDYVPVSGTLTFVNGGPSELSFMLETIDNSKWSANKSILLRLDNPVDVATGIAARSTAFIIEDDSFDPNLLDDFEDFPYLWDSNASTSISNLVLMLGDPRARPGQDAFEGVLRVDSPLVVEAVISGNVCQSNGVIPVALLTTATFDALTVDHTTVTLGNASETHIDKKTGLARRHVEDVDGDGDMDLVFHFRANETGLDCESGQPPVNGMTFDGQPITVGGPGASFSQDFAIGADWSQGEALTFWYYGSGSGAPVTLQIKDNRAPDPGPSGWGLVWSEEFDEPLGTQPNPQNWSFELGDGSAIGIPGWGNSELQYYTDDAANAATDGMGNMVLTVREADGTLDCYYGPCEYTSARLISKRKAEFAYGRIEARILVPEGQGIWPAFWSLGTDQDLVGWPQTGEIDFMEFVGRLPNEIFGTIHGPGYSGGNSFGNIFDFGEPVFNDYHTFAVEWQPDLIKWYVDGILYHTANPSDVAPNEWVFNDPVYLLLNVAIGGNFGGPVGDDFTPPQSMAVDYVRVFQGPDTAERFEATFVDDFVGWQLVEVPFADLVRSAEQPDGAPDDGLTLTEVWGYGFELAQGGSLLLDEVRLKIPPPPLAITVTNLSDSGAGSLRQALADIASGGIITFDPVLAGGTIGLTSGQLFADSNVTIDASAAPGLVVSGSSVSRVLTIAVGVSVTMNDLVVADGVGAPQGGGILNFGILNLDRVVVRDNVETSSGPASFNLGGGGIYNGDGATLNLTDSTVANNASLSQPGGGVYGFFNSTVNIVRSTISSNVSGDVAGGLRTLGNLTVVNSTIFGNVSTAWHGGAAFITDGTAEITNSTISGNIAPAGTAGGLMVATFGAPVSVIVTNSVVANNGSYNCQVEGGGAAVLTSGGNNVFTDPSCNPVASDLVVADPLLGPLADNGGPTLTQALLSGSPAIDSANGAACPASDQRGVLRPQGAGCDVGAFELEPL
jgi:beta-glucanase (GH16 family)